MLYYKFAPAADTPATGPEYPQIQKMAPGYDYDTSNSVYALSRENQNIPEYTPNLDYFVLARNAKPSDLLSAAVIYGGFLVSEKFRMLLEQFQLPTHKFYPAKVKWRKEFLNYFWMHTICDLTDYVDYPSSKFFVYQNYITVLGFVDVKSKDEYLKKVEELKKANPGKILTIWASQISLPASIIKNYDLFEIGAFNADSYISESIREAILDQKITGCDISEACNLIIK